MLTIGEEANRPAVIMQTSDSLILFTKGHFLKVISGHKLAYFSPCEPAMEPALLSGGDAGTLTQHISVNHFSTVDLFYHVVYNIFSVNFDKGLDHELG